MGAGPEVQLQAWIDMEMNARSTEQVTRLAQHERLPSLDQGTNRPIQTRRVPAFVHSIGSCLFNSAFFFRCLILIPSVELGGLSKTKAVADPPHLAHLMLNSISMDGSSHVHLSIHAHSGLLRTDSARLSHAIG